MKQTKMTTKAILFALMQLPYGSFAYVTPSTTFGIKAKPSFTTSRSPSTTTVADQKVQRTTSQKYDLGIGKNKPVVGIRKTTSPSVSSLNKDSSNMMDHSSSSSSDKKSSAMEAAKFWVAPEPVNQLPSPLQEEEKTDKHLSQLPPFPEEKKKAKKQMPILKPNRHSEDVLKIESHADKVSTILRSTATKMDVNTVWVEMLIHHQQMKLASV